MRKSSSTLWSLTLLILLMTAGPALADSVVYGGIDVWTTSPFGTSAVDFSSKPIPAGFFCTESEVFDGVVHFRGAPLVTEPPGALGTADTIVQRLDDAVFDETGVARTRVEVKALSMVSVKPIQTACGAFDVRIVLEGEQPITEMEIRRENDEGGTFSAPLEIHAQLLFTPVGEPDVQPLAFASSSSLAPAIGSQWSFRDPGLRQVNAFVVADTDGDEEPDLFLPGGSNFFAGRAVGANAGAATAAAVPCQVETFSTLTLQENSLEFSTSTGGGPSTGSTRCCIETCHCSLGSTDPLTPCDNCLEGDLHCTIVQVPCNFEPNECATGPFCC